MLGQPIEEIEARKQTPLLGMDFTFRPQASLVVLWALGDATMRRVIERTHERAVATALRWLEDEVAETRWASGRGRAKTPALVVAAFRHFDNRDGLPLLHEHCLILNRVQRLGADGEPVWGALDTYRLYQNVVAAGTLYTLAMTTEVCEALGTATVPRAVPPGLRLVMEVGGVPEDLINWSASRRQRIEDALEVLTDQYVKDHGHLPGGRVRHELGWWAAQETRPAKKKPKPLAQLLVWWRASAIQHFGQQFIDSLLERCRAAGAAIRARMDPTVSVALAAAVDVAAVVFTAREKSPVRALGVDSGHVSGVLDDLVCGGTPVPPHRAHNSCAGDIPEEDDLSFCPKDVAVSEYAIDVDSAAGRADFIDPGAASCPLREVGRKAGPDRTADPRGGNVAQAVLPNVGVRMPATDAEPRLEDC